MELYTMELYMLMTMEHCTMTTMELYTLTTNMMEHDKKTQRVGSAKSHF